MADFANAAADFWDREATAPTHVSWMESVDVRRYINASISGDAGTWPLDWFAAKYVGCEGWRFRRALSIGCGSGPLERSLLHAGIVRTVDAFDGSVVSIRLARQLADEAGYGDRVNYFVADFNRPALPRRTYDIVFFHQSLHHVGRIEKLLAAVLAALQPGGLLYIDEYIGPSRTDWNDRIIGVHRAAFELLPPEARIPPSLQLPIQADDPSEALRSSEIMPKLREGFDVIEWRPYGGSLLAVLYPAIDWRRVRPDLAGRMIEAEKQLLASGALAPYHAVVVARPKRGIDAFVARLLYFLKPKVRRIVWEVRSRLCDHEVPF